MKPNSPKRWSMLPLALALAACGGGGGGGSSTIVPSVQLTSLALSPLNLSLAPGESAQLAITGTYSDGSTKTLTATNETLRSSDVTVASVSTSGVVTVEPNAHAGATATVSATDTASGVTSSDANSTIVTVVNADGIGPTANSVQAAKSTAQNNALCSAITPFYWEIGDKNSALASDSIGVGTNGRPVLATTRLSVASASKWIYGMYVVELRGSAANLTPEDIDFLHFTSGYTNMGVSISSSECPQALSPRTVNTCLAQINPRNGLSYAQQVPRDVGRFSYDSGHLENHASLYGGLGDVPNTSLGTTVSALVAPGTFMIYSEPLLAGGIVTSGDDYAQILRLVLAGTLKMHDVLGASAVCTQPSPTCDAGFSPIPEAWHYSMAHWVEDDPSTNGDGAFSSTGAFGFYPWIDAAKTYYGIISRENLQGLGTGEQNGYASAQCGRLIRKAWNTGLEQTGTLPK